MIAVQLPVLSLLVLAAWIEPGRAQEAAGQDSPESVVSSGADSDLAQDRRRLLHLEDGRVLRRRARQVDGVWNVLEGKEWQAVAGVKRVADEREVLAQARTMGSSIESGDGAESLGRRVALAEWLAGQGLSDEAVDELERVLRVDPDHAAARALTHDMGLTPRSVPSATVDLLRAVSQASPVGRELLVEAVEQRLEATGGRETLRAELAHELTSHSQRMRESAAFTLRRLYPGQAMGIETTKGLILRSVLDGSEGVRNEASRALRDVGDESVMLPAARALTSGNSAVRENAIQALGHMSYPASVPALMSHLSALSSAQSSAPSGNPRGTIFIGKQTAYIQDFDVEVAQFQAVADPQINVLIEGSVLDARVISTTATRVVAEGRMVRSALAQITGEHPGSDNASWLDWWEANKHRWSDGAPAGEGRTSASPR